MPRKCCPANIRLMRRDLDELFAALAQSQFRSRFKLDRHDQAYLRDKGMDLIVKNAGEFICTRLAPAQPANDGKQTPWRGHPVFVAQHATGTCCRGCLARWHHIPAGVELSPEQRKYVVQVIERWLRQWDDPTPGLFC